MKIVDTGVLKPSFMDFAIPSEFAKQALYYSPQFGHFYCNKDYNINRNTLDLFLLIYVAEGSLLIESRGQSVVASRDQIVLLDCRYAHQYYCEDSADFLWFHFNGNSSALYANYLFDRFGITFSDEHITDLRKNFEAILASMQTALPNEHFISLNIHNILARLATLEKSAIVINHLLNPAIHYISDNYDKNIDLDQLSSICNISTSHFIRSFKKYINCTPHEYILSYRLRQSKKHLLSTDMSIELIAEKCGFNSASHFARAFRKSNGMTPSEFRVMQF